jgi:hypothetical protein
VEIVTRPTKPKGTEAYDSETRLVAVAHKLTDAVLGLDAEQEYGTTGRETTGGVIMASLARALVSVEKEIRDAQKAAKEAQTITQPQGRVLMIAPEIPRKAPKAS